MSSEGRVATRRLRAALLWGIALLYAASIPWYRDPSAAPVLLFGLPDWVAVALGCYGVAALFNAVAWLLTDIADPAPDSPPRDASGRSSAR